MDRYVRDLEVHFYLKIHISISIFKFESFLFLPPKVPPGPKSDGKLKIKGPRPYLTPQLKSDLAVIIAPKIYFVRKDIPDIRTSGCVTPL